MRGVGTFRAYGPRVKMREETLQRIAQAAAICAEYEAAGRPLTLRGLYYQHVARGLIENSDKSYNAVKATLTAGRMAGLISWTAIEDLGRNLRGHQTWSSPGEAMREAARRYRRPKWEDQDWYPEAWVEKHAMEGVVGHACEDLEVDYFACGGYNSMSEMWKAGRRFARRVTQGQRPIVFYMGDHDPSGFDMDRDISERLGQFAGVPVQVVRIALSTAQVERHGLPPNPTKQSDSRSGPYIEEHGASSWELDALAPTIIHDLIRDSVMPLRDPAVWEASLERENAERQEMMDAIAAAGLDLPGEGSDGGSRG